MAVTDAKLRAFLNKKRDKELFEADEWGLFFRVSKTGKVTWTYRYTFHGKKKKLALGSYPSVSIKKARELRDKNASLIANGIDPKEDDCARQSQPKLLLTVQDGIEMFLGAHTHYAKETGKHYKQALSRVADFGLPPVERISKKTMESLF